MLANFEVGFNLLTLDVIFIYRQSDLYKRLSG